MSYQILTRELKAGVVRGLYLFYGPEEFLKKHYAQEIENKTIGLIGRDVSFNLFEDKAELSSVYDACVAYPIIGEKRMVVLKDCGLLKQAANARDEKKKGKAGKSNSGALSELIDKLPDFTCLLIIEQEVDKRRAAYNKILEKGLAVEFSFRTQPELEDWAAAIAGRDGKRFTRDAVKYFIENTGGSMTEIRVELDKLLMYAADKKSISIDDVKEICRASLKVRIFDLLDHVMAGDRRRAIAELDVLLADREPAMRILSMISGHLLLLRQMKGLAASGIKLAQATQLMNLNPYRAEKLWRQGARVSPESLEIAVELCLGHDGAVKSGKMNEILSIQTLIATLSLY